MTRPTLQEMNSQLKLIESDARDLYDKARTAAAPDESTHADPSLHRLIAETNANVEALARLLQRHFV